MKKIFLILTVMLFFVFISCSIYEDETYEISDSDISINNSFQNDSTLTIDSLNLVVIEGINKSFDETWVDTTEDWLDANYIVIGIDTSIGSIDTLSDTTFTGADTTIYDTSYVYTDILNPNVVLYDTIGTVNITPKDLDNKFLLQASTKKSGYAVLDMSGQSNDLKLDIYLNSYFAITVWKADGTLLEFESHSIPVETINFTGNVIKEHYVYKMQKEKYVVRFDPSESVISGDFQTLVLVNWDRED
ncbi:MAG: hypothetical protein U9R41_08000 [Candidatus Marinimicrobia bacterium]|nr:hypothetical protein [Candidatus Neomarinimicrobiota bacterium]